MLYKVTDPTSSSPPVCIDKPSPSPLRYPQATEGIAPEEVLIPRGSGNTYSMSGQLSGLSRRPPSMTKRRTCSLDKPWYGCSASVAISQRTTPKDLWEEWNMSSLEKDGRERVQLLSTEKCVLKVVTALCGCQTSELAKGGTSVLPCHC